MRRAGGKQNRKAIYAVLVGLAVLVAGAASAPVFLPHWQSFTAARESDQPAARPVDRLGLIVVYNHRASTCRRIVFDNVSGTLNELGDGPCQGGIDNDVAAKVQARMGSLRQSFSKR